MSLPAAGVAASPCVNVCQMDAATGWCGGCLRTLDEIARWSSLDEARRHEVLACLPSRREQWLAEGRCLPTPQPPRTAARSSTA